MMILIFALIAGPVGDYLGYNYEFFVTSEGYDSLYSIMGDYGDDTIFDTVTTIDTFTYNSYPAYLNHHVRISSLFSRNDTTQSWEVGDTLFGYLNIEEDTVLAKIYVTPFYVGLWWNLEITGETLIVDIDGDDIDDTLVVQSGEGEILDSLSITVPLGTFEVFKVMHTIYMTGWQSYIEGDCRIWIWDCQWLSTNFGIVKDSIVFIDSVSLFIWIEAARGYMYSEAIDTGYVAISEHRQSKNIERSILPVLNGIIIIGSDDYNIDVYNISGRMVAHYALIIHGKRILKPALPSGVYFARVKGDSRTETIKFVIVR
jgi:hypothetical protein